MADAAAEFLIEKLKQLLIHNAHLIPGANTEVKKLEKHLRLFKTDVPKQSRNDGKLTGLLRRIRKAVYDAEDAIDAYVTRANKEKSFTDPANVVSIIEEIEADLERIRLIYSENRRSDFADIEVENGGGTTGVNEEHRPAKESNVVVGIEDETERLLEHILEESTELEIISIIGMPGLGKTILAQKIFHDPRIMFEFPMRIWVYVSQDFTAKEIFLDILKEFTILTEDIKSKSDKELADLVAYHLSNERFLLVMDDLWSPDDWDKLKVALPNSNKAGRVLITSRKKEVGRYVNGRRHPHLMRFLTHDESLQLLLLEASDGRVLPPELAAEGRTIANNCFGNPLAIVLVGGILVKQFSSDMPTVVKAWKSVSEICKTFAFDNDSMESMTKIVMMSYERLPYHLRECFLYFGMFPEDFEIYVWKLIRLWIAEGFIQQNSSHASLEETGEIYLQELIDRKLVRGVKFKLHGKVKACRVHDLILDCCVREAAREGFLQQIKMSSDRGFQPPVSKELKFRRLCIHSYVLNFVSKKPNGPSVRSFICSSREEMSMPMKDLSAIPKGFNLLRVLDVEPINFNLKLPRDLFQLLHLRYLFLSVEFCVLPSAFSQLLNIQTLVFVTRTRTLEIRADILSLSQLRHFKTNASASLLETSASSLTASENIQTIGTISPESCTKDVFDRAHNLKKLGVRGNLALLLDGNKESFDGVGKLKNLEKLKLLNDVFPIPPSGFQVLSLPQPNIFPPKLKILTLSRTYLEWCHMPIIGSLENLEVLKLEDKAFMGNIWEVSHGGFRGLEVLRIERTNLKIWLASENPFPKLKHLQLRHCDDLQQIPAELVVVPNFLKLDLFHCKRTVASAREMEGKIRHLRRFSLSISPLHQ